MPKEGSYSLYRVDSHGFSILFSMQVGKYNGNKYRNR